MTVRELIEILQKHDPEAEIIQSKDSEGNSYSPLSDVYLGVYVPENTWSGIVYNPQWTAEECDMDDEEFSEMRKKTQSVILCPIN